MIDARGMRCPWPAIRLARALRDSGGAEVTILADDPIAPRELEAVAAAAGRTMILLGPQQFRVESAA